MNHVQAYAKSSCAQCKAGHRKCDKNLPSCGRCAALKKECTYDTDSATKTPYSRSKPREKKTKTKDSENGIKLPSMEHLVDEEDAHDCHHFNKLVLAHQVPSGEKAFQYFLRGESSSNLPEDELALIYSVKSMLYIFSLYQF
jgi:hypothetical protein